MVTFDDTTAKHLQKIHFQQKLIKFMLGYIPKFDSNILEINKNTKSLTSAEKWRSTTCVTMKKKSAENQYLLPL